MEEKISAPRARVVIFATIMTICAAAVIAADEATLVADTLRYDPATGVVAAAGNVHITNIDGEIFGNAGSGATNGSKFEIHGNVRGHYRDKDGGIVNFSCAEATVEGPDNSNKVVTASGDVKLDRGKDNLSARVVVWNTEIIKYSAEGNVLGEFEAYSVDADVVSRDVDKFAARTVRKFYERDRKITMSAAKADGILKGEAVSEMIADGSVVITMPDKDGVMTRATGNRAIYSLDRGTVVLSGRASITQTGRVLHSDNIVYFMDTGHIDAQGNPSITFDTNRKNK